jgi:hypothetical protein
LKDREAFFSRFLFGGKALLLFPGRGLAGGGRFPGGGQAESDLFNDKTQRFDPRPN